jgi:hypothetical protein
MPASPFRLALLILATLLFLVAALLPAAGQSPTRVSLVPLGLAAFAGAFIVP